MSQYNKILNDALDQQMPVDIVYRDYQGNITERRILAKKASSDTKGIDRILSPL